MGGTALGASGRSNNGLKLDVKTGKLSLWRLFPTFTFTFTRNNLTSMWELGTLRAGPHSLDSGCREFSVPRRLVWGGLWAEERKEMLKCCIRVPQQPGGQGIRPRPKDSVEPMAAMLLQVELLKGSGARAVQCLARCNPGSLPRLARRRSGLARLCSLEDLEQAGEMVLLAQMPWDRGRAAGALLGSAGSLLPNAAARIAATTSRQRRRATSSTASGVHAASAAWTRAGNSGDAAR